MLGVLQSVHLGKWMDSAPVTEARQKKHNGTAWNCQETKHVHDVEDVFFQRLTQLRRSKWVVLSISLCKLIWLESKFEAFHSAHWCKWYLSVVSLLHRSVPLSFKTRRCIGLYIHVHADLYIHTQNMYMIYLSIYILYSILHLKKPLNLWMYMHTPKAPRSRMRIGVCVRPHWHHCRQRLGPKLCHDFALRSYQNISPLSQVFLEWASWRRDVN